MGKRSGELATSRAADLLEISSDTVRDWIHRALAGEDSRFFLSEVRVDTVGRFWILASAVDRIRAERVRRVHGGGYVVESQEAVYSGSSE